ncbi:hypothetical protein BCR33DRAFT_713315 [Rhizoclosmatium globosum]|uniref:Uncharacterized protein n=1 Tax=Rhizoclosmatium globosum TaxID=329046 RepID=A0A1Y2B4T2_9FUNG|nr:hypothetical protein BCR33DRAFT_724861 [Rhizoclosmatium globosum]ORY50538.1 hypothetical protein BCR33DRAFT_713315 [Rhizoclosmatium globosum]|eukprot:ORY29095.1 hypothetical protein BCR33DRAFT_724861 [Rhizoclosmatium globosum]
MCFLAALELIFFSAFLYLTRKTEEDTIWTRKNTLLVVFLTTQTVYFGVHAFSFSYRTIPPKVINCLPTVAFSLLEILYLLL